VQIAIPLFPGVTALDAVGPYEVLQRLPGATVAFVGDEVGTVRTDNGFLGLAVDATFADVPAPDVVVVPGGVGTRRLLGARPTPDRVVEHLEARVVTAAGVSSGIDMALRLSALLVDDDAARAMQLMIEYDPQPPFDAGSPATAGPAVHARVVEYARTKR
jgi:transcriptional regulator GlxA family with amidase domain